MAQPPRFAARSRIIRDIQISAQALRLYLFLEDEACGEERIAIRQQKITLALGLGRKRRRVIDLLAELQGGGYLSYRRGLYGNVYEFSYAQKTAQADVQKTARGRRNNLHMPLFEQETQEPPTPLRQESQNHVPADFAAAEHDRRAMELIESQWQGANVKRRA
jgi:hypothetical protein